MASSSGYFGHVATYDCRQSAQSAKTLPREPAEQYHSVGNNNVTLTAEEFIKYDNINNDGEHNLSSHVFLTLPDPAAVEGHTTMFSNVDDQTDFQLIPSAGANIAMYGKYYSTMNVPRSDGAIKLTAQSNCWLAEPHFGRITATPIV